MHVVPSYKREDSLHATRDAKIVFTVESHSFKFLIYNSRRHRDYTPLSVTHSFGHRLEIKMQSLTNLVLLASAVAPVFSAAIAPLQKKSVLHIAAEVDAGISFDSKVIDSDSYNTFISTEVVLLEGTDKRQDADPDRNSTIPDAIFTLQCTDDVSLLYSSYR